jgi:hypothetical protein
MDKNATMQQVDVSELAAVEGGLGSAITTNTYALWRDISNNGGFTGPTPPPVTGVGKLDFRPLLTDPFIY